MKQNVGQYSIAIIVCFIGKLPWYFDYFVHTCKYNPTISFFIVTDDSTYTRPLSPNIKIILKSLHELNSIASNKLGFAVQIYNGYKLCDFKPTYGLLFSDIIADYYYWGHADLDIIFGDIRAFISNERLNEHDLISVRHDFLTGQFLLFKNTLKMNNLFKLSRDYIKILSSPNHYCFDETNFQWDAFTDGKRYYETPSEIESMTHLVLRLREENLLKAYFDFLIIEGVPGRLRWENGKLFYKDQYEILMYHMVLFKKICKPRKMIKPIPNAFKITPTKIYNLKNL